MSRRMQKQNILLRMMNNKDKLERWHDEMQKFDQGLFYLHQKHIRYDPKSLYLLGYKNKFRIAIVWIIEWKYSTTYYNQVIDQVQISLTCIFTVEFLLKVLGMGLIKHTNSYFRDPWNYLDFLAMIIGWFELLPQIPRLKILRTFRVVRPLRNIKAFPSMRRLVTSLLQSIPDLVNVVIFLLFFLLLFGILGISIFSGNQYSRCRLTKEPLQNGTWPIDYTQTRLCSSDNQYLCKTGTYCGNPENHNIDLTSYYEDAQQDILIQYGLQSFDNLLEALLTIFQVITLEGWSKLMYNMYDTSADYLSPIYFIVIVLFGAFFLLNLILAVIMESFSQVDKKLKILELKDELRKLELRTGKTVMNTNIKTKGTKAFRKDGDTVKSRKSKSNTPKETESIFTEEYLSSSDSGLSSDEDEENKSPEAPVNKVSQKRVYHESNKSIIDKLKQIQNKQSTIKSNVDYSPQDRTKLEQEIKLEETKNNWNVKVKDSDRQSRSENSRSIRVPEFQDQIADQEVKDEFTDYAKQQNQVQERAKKNKFYGCAYKVCKSKCFAYIVFLIIIGNIADLYFDRYPISNHEEKVLSLLNMVFFGGFIMELLIKFIGLGISGFAKDRYNLFDCITILLQITQISLYQSLEHTEGTKILVGLKSLALFRVLKLAQYWKGLQDLIRKVGYTIKDISNFMILLFLFIFIYALLGMELYANLVRFDDNDIPMNCDQSLSKECEGTQLRANFDTWPNAMITVFILLVGDDWNTYMFDYVRATSKVSIIYFVSLTILGNIILLNLFLAILLKQFEQEHSIEQDQASDLKTTFIKIKVWVLDKYYQFVDCIKSKRIKKYSNDATINNQQQNEKKEPVQDSLEFEESGEDHKEESHVSRPANNQGMDIEDLDNEANHSKRQLLDESNDPMNQLKVESIENSFDNRGLLRKTDVNEHQDDFKNNKTMIITKDKESSKVLEQNFFSLMQKAEKVNHNKNELDLPPRKRGSIFDSSINSNPIYQQMYLGINNHLENRQILAQTMKESASPMRQAEQRMSIFHKTFSDQGLSAIVQLEGNSLWVFGPKNRFRKMVARLVKAPYFESFIIFLIIASTVTLAMEKPLNDPASLYTTVLYYIDLAFSILFGVECLLKIVAFGFLCNKSQSYILNPWNAMDFVIIITNYVSMISDNDFKSIKSLRMLRILRPLRMISRNEGLMIAVLCLINAIKGIFNIFVISMFSFSVYGIFGVNFFKGQFYYCHTDHLTSYSKTWIESYSETKWECINMGGEWINFKNRFDQIFYAVLTLFEMSTTEGWVDVLWKGIDSTDIDYLPQKNNNLPASIYFIGFILLGSLFIMNLFVGIVINTFKYEKERLGLDYLLTDTQKEWVKVQIKCYQAKPKPKEQQFNNKLRRIIAFVGRSKQFETTIYICIILNTVILAINWYDMPENISTAFDYVNHVFTGIFTLEAIIKITIYGRQYFKEGWNIFDIVILAGTFMQIISLQIFNTEIGARATILRVFRIGRILRIIKKAKSLSNIFNTLLVTLPSLANIGFLLFLLIIFYSILGVNLFAKVKINGEMNSYANFQNFWNGFVTLIRCATGEQWNDLMRAMMNQKSVIFDCIDDPTYDDILANGGEPNGCGSYWASVLFFLTYMIFVTFIFLNLFIAIILEGFSDTSEEKNLRVDHLMIMKFINIWQDFDPEGTGFIQVSEISLFFKSLIQQKTEFIKGGDFLLRDDKEMKKFIAELQLPIYNNFTQFHYQDILNHLSKTIFKIDFERYMLMRKAQEEGDDTQLTSQSNIDQFLQAQDQLQYNSFEELMFNFSILVKKYKISLYEELRRYRLLDEKRKIKYKDKYEAHFYDSRVIIYIPKLIEKLRDFTILMKRRRLDQSEQQMKEQAIQEINKLKLLKSPQQMMQKQRRQSIFTMLARSAQDQQNEKSNESEKGSSTLLQVNPKFNQTATIQRINTTLTGNTEKTNIQQLSNVQTQQDEQIQIQMKEVFSKSQTVVFNNKFISHKFEETDTDLEQDELELIKRTSHDQSKFYKQDSLRQFVEDIKEKKSKVKVVDSNDLETVVFPNSSEKRLNSVIPKVNIQILQEVIDEEQSNEYSESQQTKHRHERFSESKASRSHKIDQDNSNTSMAKVSQQSPVKSDKFQKSDGLHSMSQKRFDLLNIKNHSEIISELSNFDITMKKRSSNNLDPHIQYSNKSLQQYSESSNYLKSSFMKLVPVPKNSQFSFGGKLEESNRVSTFQQFDSGDSDLDDKAQNPINKIQSEMRRNHSKKSSIRYSQFNSIMQQSKKTLTKESSIHFIENKESRLQDLMDDLNSNSITSENESEQVQSFGQITKDPLILYQQDSLVFKDKERVPYSIPSPKKPEAQQKQSPSKDKNAHPMVNRILSINDEKKEKQEESFTVESPIITESDISSFNKQNPKDYKNNEKNEHQTQGQNRFWVKMMNADFDLDLSQSQFD